MKYCLSFLIWFVQLFARCSAFTSYRHYRQTRSAAALIRFSSTNLAGENATPSTIDIDKLQNAGVIQIFQREDEYDERRTDGYVEPKKIYVIGTNHFSNTSAQQVTALIGDVKPDKVVIELCRGRSTMLLEIPEFVTQSEMMSNMIQSIQKAGLLTFLLKLLFANMGTKLATMAGGNLGADFRAARSAAEKLGVEVVLGDRPIELTLRRAWDSLTWNERVKFVTTILDGLKKFDPKQLDALNASHGSQATASPSPSSSSSSSTAQEQPPPSTTELAAEPRIAQLPSDEVFEMMDGVLMREFPSLHRTLIEERDKYIAWALKRSMAVKGADTVVGVVGYGHVRGVMRALEADNGGRSLIFTELTGKGNGVG